MLTLIKKLFAYGLWMLLVWVQPVSAAEIVSPGIGMSSPWSVAWVDINGDGRSDYCFLYGTDGERIRCYAAGPTGQFSATPVADTVIGGTGGSWIWWADVDGDGRTDVCRADQATYLNSSPHYPGAYSHSLWCRLAKNLFAAPSVATHVPELVSVAGVKGLNKVFFTDIDGDQKSDMCYLSHESGQPVILAKVRCHRSTDTGFSGPTAAWTSMQINVGTGSYPRSFVDVNGDGAPDYCRTWDDNTLRCLLGSETGFTTTDLVSPVVDRGTKEGAAFVDANGDGKTDFCRITGTSGSYRLRCTLSTGVGWDTTDERVSPVIPNATIGHAYHRWWVDINADGLPDFCRAVGADPNAGNGESDVQSTVACRLNKGDGSSTDPTGAFYYGDISLNVNFGRSDGPRQWCDAEGNGVTTFCRSSRVVVYGSPCDESGCPVTSDTSSLITGLSGDQGAVQAEHPTLRAYTDGLGAETRITYLPLTNPDVYSRSGITNTTRRFVGPPPTSPVVYETRAWLAGNAQAGTGLTHTGNARYFYRDLTSDPWAGVSRGFSERWMFSEGANTLDHTQFFQGLGDGNGSVENDLREIGMVRQQLRYVVNSGVIPTPSNTSNLEPSQRNLLLKSTITKVLEQLGGTGGMASKATIASKTSTSSSPFILLQSTENTLKDTVPANTRYRFIGSSSVEAYDYNGSSRVLLPKVTSTTSQDEYGNVTALEQKREQQGNLTWVTTTTNTYDSDTRWKRLGRLKSSTVTSTAPSLDTQIAANARSAGTSANASAVSSSLAAVGQEPPKPMPLPPQLLMPILQLLLED